MSARCSLVSRVLEADAVHAAVAAVLDDLLRGR